MPVKTFTLTSTLQDINQSEWQIGPEDVGGTAQGYRIRKRTLHGGLPDGVEVIEIDNGTFRFTVVPTRGMGIWKGWLGDVEIGFQSPVPGPVHPKFVNVGEASGLGWLDGFDELLVRCGLESNGAPEFDAETGRLRYPLHGRIANKPAHFVEVSVDDETGEIKVVGVVDEVRFHFCRLRLTSTITTSPGEQGFRIVDEVTNLSGESREMQLLYHINFSQPLLDRGARFVAPIKTMVPKDAATAKNMHAWNVYPAPTVGFTEEVYFFELLSDARGQTMALLQNSRGDLGVSVKFSTSSLPYFTLWKDTLAVEDGYVTGLEPATNFPNARSYEADQGRIIKLASGETKRFEVALKLYTDAQSVRSAEETIAAIQGATPQKIFDQPQKGWTP